MRGPYADNLQAAAERAIRRIDIQLNLLVGLCGCSATCPYHQPKVDDLLDRRLAEQAKLDHLEGEP